MAVLAQVWWQGFREETDMSLPTYQILLKFTSKFKIAFSRKAKEAAESELSISVAFTESLVHHSQ